jgi:hypothetical protein
MFLRKSVIFNILNSVITRKTEPFRIVANSKLACLVSFSGLHRCAFP